MTVILSSTVAGTPKRIITMLFVTQSSLYGTINCTHKIMRICPIWKKLDTNHRSQWTTVSHADNILNK